MTPSKESLDKAEEIIRPLPMTECTLEYGDPEDIAESITILALAIDEIFKIPAIAAQIEILKDRIKKTQDSFRIPPDWLVQKTQGTAEIDGFQLAGNEDVK